ncbi:MAG TPA: hypothetical protein VG889_11420 [Rhizomicrobium sp.]|nr:hypothetical protein [Rhizomicrobium sp.]
MSAELPFSADFTARVLKAADAAVARRRLFRAGAAMAFVLAGGIVAAGLLRPAAPPQAWAEADLEIAATDDLQTEPVDYMFPDAAALSQFSQAYSGGAEDDDE